MSAVRTVEAFLFGLWFLAPGPALAQTAPKDCPLCEAAKAGDLGATALLLERGANVNARDVRGDSPLDYALSQKKFDEALFLVKRGAKTNVNINSENGEPLIMAVDAGDLALTEALIKLGAHHLEDALFHAAENHRPDLVQVLLDAGADPNAKDDNDFIPLDHAVGAAVMQIDQKTGGPDDASLERLRETLPTVRLLLGAGAKADASDPAIAVGWASKGQSELLELLLAHGARVDTMRIPLDWWEWVPDKSGMDELVDAGANPDMENDDGDTALNLAVKCGDVDQARALLDLGADPNHPDHDKAYPMRRAILDKNEKMFALLLSRGADIGIPMGAPNAAAPSRLEIDENGLPPTILEGARAYVDYRSAILPMVQRLPGLMLGEEAARRDPGTVSLEDYQKLRVPPQTANLEMQYFLRILAFSLATPPTVPEDAASHEAMGLDLYNRATTRSGLLAAAREYELAAEAAPWLGAYHRNLCVLEHLAGAYARALAHCGIYKLEGPPDAAEIDAIIADSEARLKDLAKPAA